LNTGVDVGIVADTWNAMWISANAISIL
jgi:hypothetical protein